MPDDYDKLEIEKIKQLFYSPEYGGSNELRSVVESLVKAESQKFAYVSKHVTRNEQRRTEYELAEDGDDWINSTSKLQSELGTLLRLGLIENDRNREKFMAGIEKLGLSDDVADPQVHPEWHYHKYAQLLAQHYVTNLSIEQSTGRFSGKQ